MNSENMIKCYTGGTYYCNINNIDIVCYKCNNKIEINFGFIGLPNELSDNLSDESYKMILCLSCINKLSRGFNRLTKQTKNKKKHLIKM